MTARLMCCGRAVPRADELIIGRPGKTEDGESFGLCAFVLSFHCKSCGAHHLVAHGDLTVTEVPSHAAPIN